MENTTIGFIGIGHLADYTIKGLRFGGFKGDILLNPRNQQRARQLATEFDCKVQIDNQAVSDSSDILILSTRPAECLDTLSQLNFRPEQLLVSVVAGVDIETLSESIEANVTIIRALPVSCAEAAASPTLIFPSHRQVENLFDYCGNSIVVDEESEFNHASVLTCVYSWYFELFETLIKTTSGPELSPQLATKMVLGMAKGAASLALHDAARTPGEIVAGIATEGTYSKLGLDVLKHKNAFEPWQQACRVLREKLG